METGHATLAGDGLQALHCDFQWLNQRNMISYMVHGVPRIKLDHHPAEAHLFLRQRTNSIFAQFLSPQQMKLAGIFVFFVHCCAQRNTWHTAA